VIVFSSDSSLILAYSVRWRSVLSQSFSLGNGIRRGGVLSPYVYDRYIRYKLVELESTQEGCNIGGIVQTCLLFFTAEHSWLFLSFRDS
jgi:hypothetical protein